MAQATSIADTTGCTAVIRLIAGHGHGVIHTVLDASANDLGLAHGNDRGMQRDGTTLDALARGEIRVDVCGVTEREHSRINSMLARMMRTLCMCAALVLLGGCASMRGDTHETSVVVLGIAQDGGVPQAGSFADERWDDPSRMRQVVCLGIIDARAGKRWMIEATPDFKRQLLQLYRASHAAPRPVLDGIFLTHAHMGHYTGLMFLGHESMGAQGVPVYAMPKMSEFLQHNGPWEQLVRYGNIELRPMASGQLIQLADDLSIEPIAVPHRQEYSEVVGFRIKGPSRSVLFIPDIDSWEQWDALGTRIEDLIASVDVAYLDGTFFDNGEIPGRDMTGFPHPFVRHSLNRFAALSASERAKIRFIHFNHTNPALDESSDATRVIHDAGMNVAREGERQDL